MALFTKAPEQEQQDNLKAWPNAKATIDDYSGQKTPLHDRLAQGTPVRPEEMLSYIAALELRIARLEQSR